MIDKPIQYISKDFNSFKSQLIDFAKTYYPTTYNDFTETSPGMMLIEMSSYVGDVLSFYQDNQINENFLAFTKQRKNLLSQAYSYGYKPQITSVSNVLIDIYQIIPAKNVFGIISPDFTYSLIIDEESQIQSSQNSNIKFIIENKIDFSISGSNNPTEVSVYSVDNLQQPEYYLLKKQSKAYSGNIKQSTFNFGSPQRFTTINISDDKIIKILDIYDSDNNKWDEVDYLGQETIFEKVNNDQNPKLSQYKNETPYLLKLKKTPKRFVSRFKTDNNLEIQFGSGVSSNQDEEIIPNSENIGLGLSYEINKLDIAYDPSNFLYTQTYGISPSNTNLIVRYLVGGGIESNVPSNTLNKLISGNVTFNGNVDPSFSNIVINSLSFNNEIPSVGGGNGDSNEDLRQNIMSTIPSQLRAVTMNDYLIRTLSLPSEYGVISKVHIDKDTLDSDLLSFYILSRNLNNNLCIADLALKTNLKTYLGEYKMLTDSINIKDGFIINIGINFDITVRPNFINKLVINDCLNILIKYFNIDRWKINQPIILSEIYSILDKVNGVQTVKKIEISNKSGELNGYSKYSYDIQSATINGIIYPSQDPSIFEVKFINDIQGKSVSF